MKPNLNSDKSYLLNWGIGVHSLTSCVCKTIERMIKKRLVETFERANKPDHRQFASRSGRGTNTYFATLGEVLVRAKEKGQHVEAVALIFEKAYNSITGLHLS